MVSTAAAAVATALVATACVLGALADDTPSYPFFASDNAGHLHINTSSPDQDVFVNGVSFSQLAKDVAELKAVVGLTENTDPKRGRITDVIDVHDDAVYISAKNGVFLSSGAAHVINEASTSWNPSSLDCNVGDRVTFKWSSLEAVYETQADGSTAVQGGYNSGDATIGGEFTVWLNEAKTYKFRAANKGFVLTVNANPAGMKPGSRFMQFGAGDGVIILGTGYSYSSGCYGTTGAMYNSNGCKCRAGTVKQVYDGYSSSYNLYMCIA